MDTAKIFENGRSQAVRLPKKYRFDQDEVYIKQVGRAVILMPIEDRWEQFLAGLQGFSDDFMQDGRLQLSQLERETL